MTAFKRACLPEQKRHAGSTAVVAGWKPAPQKGRVIIGSTMFNRFLWVLLLALPAAAQNGSQNRKLALIIPNLYGDQGLTLNNPTHFAHFDSDFQANFVPFNTALASQLTSLPIPSPASGFTYTFDKSLGVYTRSAQSLGPILAERAETITTCGGASAAAFSWRQI